MKKHLIWLTLLVPFIFFWIIFSVGNGSINIYNWEYDVRTWWLILSAAFTLPAWADKCIGDRFMFGEDQKEFIYEHIRLLDERNKFPMFIDYKSDRVF